MALWRWITLNPLPSGGIAFLIYACLSLSWAPSPHDSALGLCQVVLWALAFWFGSAVSDLRLLWRGFAVLLAVSSMVSAAQAFGWDGVPARALPEGLLGNSAVAGAAASLVIVALVCARDFLLIPALIPGFVLAQSRGAWLVLGAGLAARYLHWSTVLLLVMAVAAVALRLMGAADGLRLQVWHVAMSQMSMFGLGAGSFVDIVYPGSDGAMIRPEYAHNDYLQLAAEYGIGAVPVALIWARGLGAREARDWPVMVGFAVLATFTYPLYVASLAFMGAALAGHLLRT